MVRSDIPVGLQMAQSVHAAFLFAQKHPELTTEWLENSQYLVIVSVPSEDHLIAKSLHAKKLGITHEVWREPDLNDEVTAIALEPSAASRRLCANLPLAGSRERERVLA